MMNKNLRNCCKWMVICVDGKSKKVKVKESQGQKKVDCFFGWWIAASFLSFLSFLSFSFLHFLQNHHLLFHSPSLSFLLELFLSTNGSVFSHRLRKFVFFLSITFLQLKMFVLSFYHSLLLLSCCGCGGTCTFGNEERGFLVFESLLVIFPSNHYSWYE